MPLAKIIADEDEEAYNALNRYIEHSTPMWNLYCYLEPLINDITNDYGGKKILEKKLSRFSNPE